MVQPIVLNLGSLYTVAKTFTHFYGKSEVEMKALIIQLSTMVKMQLCIYYYINIALNLFIYLYVYMGIV